MSSLSSSLQIQPLSGTLGAEIAGVNLAEPMSERLFEKIRSTFFQYQVICFRDQELTPEQQIAFAKRWGTINVNRFFARVKNYPMIAEIRKEPEHTQNIGEDWHTDHSYDTKPAFTSILYAKVVPNFGGDTLFASMYAAYESLSDGMKKMLLGMRARHSSRQVFGYSKADLESRQTGRINNPEQAIQDAVHPVVITHPGSGRKALYVNPDFTVGFEGWTDEESKPLLEYLYKHAGQPRFTCRLSWTKGTLAMWDNRATWHCALNDYHGQRRVMHRITVEGEPLSKI